MARVFNWQIGREMSYWYPEHRPQRQFAAVFDTNKCIACQTCTLACKTTWTSGRGQEYMLWNNVESKPYGSYPLAWDLNLLRTLDGGKWNGSRYEAHASEAGHADFAPRTALEASLLRFLAAKYGRVSYERILSGHGLVDLFAFLNEEPAFRALGRPETAAAMAVASIREGSKRSSARPILTESTSTPFRAARALLTAFRQCPQDMPSMWRMRFSMIPMRSSEYYQLGLRPPRSQTLVRGSQGPGVG